MAIVGYDSYTGKFLVQDSYPFTNVKGRGKLSDKDGTWISPNDYTIQQEYYTLISRD